MEVGEASNPFRGSVTRKLRLNVFFPSSKFTALGSPVEPGQMKDCPLDPYQIVHDKCEFVDSQTLKLQEAPDMVPVGELPRHLILFADRYAG